MRFVLGAAILLVLMLAPLSVRLAAQVQTGSVSGTVTDPTGAVIVGAKVQLILSLTGATRTTTSDARGNFVFGNVSAGTYELRISQTGFKSYDHVNIQLASGETLALHKIPLQVGATSTQVTVSAEAARVQTTTAGSSGLISNSQIANIPNKGRNYMDYLTLLPGVVGTPGGTNSPQGIPGAGMGHYTFNGGDSGTVLVLLNGIASQNPGAPGAVAYISPSTDSIAEERVHTGVESAQYGGRAGGTVDVVTKHGTNQFHGDLYWFNRNNFYNANDYFRKLQGLTSPAPYKFNDLGGTIGGPILFPRLKFNRSRQRAFFFFSYEKLIRTVSYSPTNMTTPTPAERAGVFTNLTQNLVNPAGDAAQQPTCSGTAPDITCTFPTAAINPAGQGLLGVLPLPTCLRQGDSATGLNSALAGLPACSNNSANYSYVNSTPFPWYNDVLRTDFKLSNNESFYIVIGANREEEQHFLGFVGGAAAWPQAPSNFLTRSKQAMASLTSTLSSTVVNVANIGLNYAIQTVAANSAADLLNNNRAALGLGPTVLPVLFPDASNGGAQSKQVNPYDLIPSVTFGGQTNQSPLVGGNSKAGSGVLPHAANMRFESRYPLFGTVNDYTFTDNLSWVKGNHNMKFGIDLERVRRVEAAFTNPGGAGFNGVLNFSSHGIYTPTNANGSPFDTGNTFANALVGAFNSYGSVNTRLHTQEMNYDLEWYGQDQWQVVPRLTLDIGMRFGIISPDHLRNGQLISEFEPYLFNAANQPGLVLPCVPTSGPNTGFRVGCESNGNQVPASAIGAYDPTTYGGSVPSYSGMFQSNGYVYAPARLTYAPRIGFAWDIFGNGKTALRAGFGMFYDRTGGVDDVGTKADEPPLLLSPFIYNSTIQQVLTSGGQRFLSPQGVAGAQRTLSNPQAYNTHMDIQQDLSHGILLDVGYVGVLSRHFQQHYQYNGLPYGENFQSTYQDPTQPTGTPYIANIIRCLDPTLYCGYSSIVFSQFDGNSNYNALEVTVNKRFGSHFIGGASYTWSKVLDFAGCCDTHTTPYLPGGARYFYGPGSGDRRQNLTLNWHYNLPLSPFNSAFAKEALNGWSLEGIASFISGAPRSLGVSYSGDPNGGGGPVGAVVSGNIVHLQKTSKGVFYLNTNAFTAAAHGPGVCQLNDPATCGLGDSSPKSVFTGPGTNNWDISLLKKFPLGKNESRYFEFRWETYNTFNHTQFSNPSAGTHFSGAAGSANTNSTLGQITSQSVPSRIQVFGLKLYF